MVWNTVIQSDLTRLNDDSAKNCGLKHRCYSVIWLHSLMIQLKNPMHEEFMRQAASVVYVYSNDCNSTLSCKGVSQKLCNIWGGGRGERFENVSRCCIWEDLLGPQRWMHCTTFHCRVWKWSSVIYTIKCHCAKWCPCEEKCWWEHSYVFPCCELHQYAPHLFLNKVFL